MSKNQRKNIIKELAEELDVFDEMISALVELLEDKGILTQKEWEDRIKSRIEAKKCKKPYREIQFQEWKQETYRKQQGNKRA